MSIVVYTAIFGCNGDELHRPENAPEGVRYEAFVDDPRTEVHNGWTLRPTAFPNLAKQPRRMARWHKLSPHALFPDAKHTMWVDGSFTPRVDPNWLVERYLTNHDVASFKHAQRDCVYAELDACLRRKKDDPATMRAQIARYRKIGYPAKNGLVETCAMLQRTCRATKELFSLWRQELGRGSLRDQLSFDYCCWALNFKYATFEHDRYHVPYFAWRPH